MPDSISSGPQVWKFFNQGQSVHNFGIVKLNEEMDVEDVISWMGDPSTSPPMEIVSFWNLMSPGASSRAILDLTPGEYMALDFLPDEANGGKFNIQQGMSHTFTVTQ
jgi:hypothetical protein